MSSMKIALVHEEMREHAEWLKHEAGSQKIEATLLKSPLVQAEEIDEYDAFVFLAFSTETVLIQQMNKMAIIASQLGIPFIWTVDQFPHINAYQEFSDFEQEGVLQDTLSGIFALGQSVTPKATNTKGSKFQILNRIKKEKSVTTEEQQEEYESTTEEDIVEEELEKQVEEFVLDDLDDLPPLEEESKWEEPNNTSSEVSFDFGTEEPVVEPTPQPSFEEDFTFDLEEDIQMEYPSDNQSEDEVVEEEEIEEPYEYEEETPQDDFSVLTISEDKEVQEESWVEEETFSIFEDVKPKPKKAPKNEDIEEINISKLTNVIAVAGAGHGVGTSFIALNLAYALQAVLVEGKKTGTLAEWLGKEECVERDGYLHGEIQGKYPVFATTELSTMNELNVLRLKAKSQPFVVDCELDSLVWKFAEYKIFVVSADPQYRDIPIPKNAKLVINQYPKDFPIPAQKLFNQTPDLIIYEDIREVMLSLWAKVPYLKKHPQGTEEWIALLDQQDYREQNDETGDLEWNLEKPL